MEGGVLFSVAESAHARPHPRTDERCKPKANGVTEKLPPRLTLGLLFSRLSLLEALEEGTGSLC